MPSPDFSSPDFSSDAQLALVTGATSGIGKEAARLLAAAGYAVVGTTRNPATVKDPLQGVHYVALDLTSPESVEACAAEVLELGTPAVLINNAGESQSGPFEELPRDALERLFQVNVLAHVQLTQKFLPAMRAAGSGRVVMVGSMLGSFPLAFRSSYVASKAAIKGFAFSARRELRPYGVHISVVEPGSINTGLSARRTKYVDQDGTYSAEFTTMLKNLDANEASGISAQRVAEEIMKAVEAEKPRALYAVGSKARLVFPLSRLLPREVMHSLINKKHGL